MGVTEAPEAGASQLAGVGAAMSVDAVRRYLRETFPQVFEAQGVSVEEAANGCALLRLTPNDTHLRPGGIVAGPTLMMLADAAAYAALLSGTDAAKMAVTSNLNVSFLRPVPAGEDILQDARVVKWGRRLSVLVCEARMGSGAAIAQTTITYAMPIS